MEDDLEIGIPREVIKLKSMSRKLKFALCLLILYNIFCVNGLSLLFFTLEESFGYLSIEIFNTKCLNYYFLISVISCAYRFYLITSITHIYNNDYNLDILIYILPSIFFKSSFIFHLLIFRDKLLQLDRNSLLITRNIRYI